MIENLKYQQNQAAFKEQIALLEDIKAKQLDLERMQRLQYKQEKKLLRQKASLQKFEKSNKIKPNLVENDADQDIKEERNAEDDDDNEKELSITDSVSLDEDSLSEKENSKKSARNADQVQNSMPQIDSATNESNSNTSAAGTTSNTTYYKFLKNMDERAKFREQLKIEREEKRKKQEMERLELLRGEIKIKSLRRN